MDLVKHKCWEGYAESERTQGLARSDFPTFYSLTKWISDSVVSE